MENSIPIAFVDNGTSDILEETRLVAVPRVGDSVISLKYLRVYLVKDVCWTQDHIKNEVKAMVYVEYAGYDQGG